MVDAPIQIAVCYSWIVRCEEFRPRASLQNATFIGHALPVSSFYVHHLSVVAKVPSFFTNANLAKHRLRDLVPETSQYFHLALTRLALTPISLFFIADISVLQSFYSRSSNVHTSSFVISRTRSHHRCCFFDLDRIASRDFFDSGRIVFRYSLDIDGIVPAVPCVSFNWFGCPWSIFLWFSSAGASQVCFFIWYNTLTVSALNDTRMSGRLRFSSVCRSAFRILR